MPEGKSYAALFGGGNDAGDFGSFGEFLRVVASGRWDPRLDHLQTKAMVAGDATLGGFAVPEAWAGFLFDGIVNESAILPRARMVPMNALTLHVPAWDDLNQSTGTVYGGFQGVWLAEGAEATEQTAKVRQIRLDAHKLAIFTSISRELILGTQGNMEIEVRRALTRAVAARLDEAFLSGDDVQKPEGILNAPALKGITRTTASTVKYADLANILAGMHPAFIARSTWYINPSVLAVLLKIEDTAGHLVWQPSGADAAPTTIFGRPVVYSDRLPALGSKGDVMLVADEGYLVGMVQNIVVETATGPLWAKDLLAMRCIVLADGQLSFDKVYTAPDAATYSIAVALNA